MLMYIISVKPFKEPRLNKLEIFNELTVLLCAYHIPLFSDFVPDPDIRYIAGWSIILITCSNLMINIGIVTYLSLSDIKKKLKRSCTSKEKRFPKNKGLPAVEKIKVYHNNLVSLRNQLPFLKE